MKENTAELVAQLRSNAVEAFDRLIEHYGDRLYWHIRRIVVNHEDAEDVFAPRRPLQTLGRMAGRRSGETAGICDQSGAGS